MNKSTILLIEDDNKLASLTQQYLVSAGFHVEIESDGNQAIKMIQKMLPDLLILDIMLPGKDGLSICKEARTFYDAPILMLTARNEDFDQVLGLEFGADDYVIKPAEPRVLLARINALLRRKQRVTINQDEQVKIGKLHIDIASRQVHLEGNKILLSTHEFDLIVIFSENIGQILSRDYLFQKLYGREYDGLDRSMDVRISQLRKKLGDSAEEPEKIKTIWGKGYLMVSNAW